MFTPAVVAATSTTLTTAANPAPFQETNLTATVSTASGTPTGTVTFYDGSTEIGSAPVGAGGKASLYVDTLLPGTHSLTATYGGDAADAPSTSAALSQQVGKAFPYLTSITRTAQPVAGGVRFTFTTNVGLVVFDVSPPPPTGTVIFYNGSTQIGSAPVSNRQATLTVTLPGPGGEQVTAVYSGDSNYSSATSPAPPTALANPGTSTAVTTSANPASPAYGTQFVATVQTVTPITQSPYRPLTGAVSFYDGTTLLGSSNLVNSQATFNAASLAPGSHAITAVYGGDTSYDPSTSAVLSQGVTPVQTLAAVSVSTGSTAYGVPIMLSASLTHSLTGQNLGAPTGTITFYDGSTALDTETVNSPGIVSFSTSSLPAGSHAITAVYSGDPNYAKSTSAVSPVIVTPVATSLALSAPTGAVAAGQAVTLSAIVTPNPAVAQPPTGSVAFYYGTTLLGSAPLTGNTAVLTVSNMPAGSGGLAFSATYQGDGNFTASSSTSAQVISGPPSTLFLNQLYLDLLGRPVDAGGLAYWSGRLSLGVSRYTVALAIESSREFAVTTLANLSQSLSGQAPTAAMTNQAIALQASNQANPVALEAIVLNSLGFFQARAGVTPLGFVTAVSRAVTGLPPDPTMLPSLLALASQGKRSAVVSAVLSSASGLSAQVVNDYNRYLGRAPQAGDVAYFVAQLQSQVSPSVVIAQFVSSPEYYNKATLVA